MYLKHGHSAGVRSGGKVSPEYRAWMGMKRRCNWRGYESWSSYGGRGIKVCERWLSSFESFLLDMGPKPSPKHSIDRIDNDGNYEPGNCRWATVSEQNKNKSPEFYRHLASLAHMAARARWSGIKENT